MRRRTGQIFLLSCGVICMLFGVVFNLLPGIIKKSDVMTPLLIGIGLIILTGLAKKKVT